jgi:hypothetical protein
MMAIADYPRCAAYLKGMRCRLDDPTMTDYWWAVILSQKWTDEELVADGRVNFETMAGPDILTEFERLLRDGIAKPRLGISHEVMERLRAFLGSRGIKTSALRSSGDYWRAASILWPQAVHLEADHPLPALVTIISGMTKKQRQSANGNLHKVPAEWRAGGSA